MNSPYRFMAWVLLLMVPFFGLWYALGALPAAPAFYVARLSMEMLLPNVVDSVSLDGTRMVILTHFGETAGTVLPAMEAGNQLAFPADLRLMSYSVPFYAALLFASRVSQPVERFARGLILLWLLMALGFISVCLKNLMLGLGDVLYTASSFPLPPRAAIALVYQLNTLIVPTLAPVLIWAWLASDAQLFTRFRRTPESHTGSDAEQ